ncbi:MAG TPA: fibronectin type III domain-containing protein [Vicinamibacterales bacterium]|nr:fibronectin type III domain-containing protein [Vicinamibacterales bacterium]
MPKKLLFALSVATVSLMVACGRSNSPVSPSPSVSGTDAGPDGSTLKINAPQLLSPTNNTQLKRTEALVLVFQNVTGKYTSFPVTYEVELRRGNTVVMSQKVGASSGSTTSLTVTNALDFDTNHDWRVRATYRNSVGPWSNVGTFKTALKAFLDPVTGAVFDPLTEGFSVGKVHGGRFIIGQGWQTVTRSDGIDYDIPTCPDCRVEFDMTGIGDGLGQPHDDKWLSMGDALGFNGFDDFRNQDWKMTLEQRADGDGTGMKLIWRNGDAGDGDPGDHDAKQDPGPDWQENVKYHFVFDWNPRGFKIIINGETWFEDGFDEPYAPPNHRISIGCYPRGETRRDAIYSNFEVIPRR